MFRDIILCERAVPVLISARAYANNSSHEYSMVSTIRMESVRGRRQWHGGSSIDPRRAE